MEAAGSLARQRNPLTRLQVNRARQEHFGLDWNDLLAFDVDLKKVKLERETKTRIHGRAAATQLTSFKPTRTNRTTTEAPPK